MHNPELSEQEQIRRNSLEEIKNLGINPYPPETFEISHKTREIVEIFEKQIEKADLLIIDELSYLTFNRHQSELLFKVVADRAERRSVIVSTNLRFVR